MGLSRLETYLAILKVLENWNSITQKQIIQKADLKLLSPKEDLNSLVNLDLIRERTQGKKRIYSITCKGQKVTRYFVSKDEDSIFGGSRITRIDVEVKFCLPFLRNNTTTLARFHNF